MRRYIIEKSKLERNIARVCEQAGGAVVYAAVKADGYGVGCARLAWLCAENGIRRFAVTSPEEALAVSRAGIRFEDMLMLTPLAETDKIISLTRLGVSFTVASESDARLLQSAWYITSLRPRVHVKIDTGMGRRGFFPKEQSKIRALYEDYPELDFVGIYSHFCCGYDARQTRKQFRAFREVLDGLASAGIDPGIRHISASAALFYHPEMNLDAVRVGSALFGRIAGAERFGLAPTGHCAAEIEQLRELPAGSTVGYGAGYKTRRPIRTATCRIGTHYGFGVGKSAGKQIPLREFRTLLRQIREHIIRKSLPFAVIDGQICPVLGAIGSESVTVDVTGVTCQTGDEALFDINPTMLSHMDIEIL